MEQVGEKTTRCEARSLTAAHLGLSLYEFHVRDRVDEVMTVNERKIYAARTGGIANSLAGQTGDLDRTKFQHTAIT